MKVEDRTQQKSKPARSCMLIITWVSEDKLIPHLYLIQSCDLPAQIHAKTY